MMNDGGGKFDDEMNDEFLIGGGKSEYPDRDPNLKWKTLEHRGVTFFQGYEPHGVKLLY